jgi:hypothetical protein
MKKLESIVIVLSALLALPFLLVLPWMALFRLLVGLFPSAAPLFLLELPAYLFFVFLSSLPRYFGFSLAALLLSLTGLMLVFARERGHAWRCKRLYLPVLGILAVLAFPLLMRYRPAAEAAPGIELRHVDPPGLLEGVVKHAQVAAETSAYQYEPLGWADAQTFVYRRWRGGRYQNGKWHPGTEVGPLAYYLDVDVVALFEGNPDTLVYQPCAIAPCVEPGLRGEGPPHFVGHYSTPLASPDGWWVAFTARHAYGPEDLFVIASSARSSSSMPQVLPAPTRVLPMEPVHTPEEMRDHFAAWPDAYKYAVDDDIGIMFAHPHPTILWGGAAFVQHAPSMSTVILDENGKVTWAKYGSSEAEERLEAILRNRAWQARIQKRIQEIRIAPSDSYDFPVKGGTSEWAAFQTHDEMVAACQVPEPILRDMSTEGLIETCLRYPLIGDMGMYSSWQQGFDRVAARFNGLQELLQRPDAGTKLLAYYRQMEPAGIREKSTSLQKGQVAMTFQYVETLLAQEAVLSSMTVDERRDLLVECLGKVHAKEEPDYNVVDVAYTVWVMGRILITDTPDSLELEGRPESRLAYFLEEGSFVNEQVIGEILTRAEQYLADG